MKKILFVFVLMCSMAVRAADDVFVLPGINVSAEDEFVTSAKEKAVKQGQEEAFYLLLNKIVDDQSSVSFEEGFDVSSFVQDVSLSDEKFFAKSYKGVLTVRFKAGPIRELLTQKGVSFLSSLPNQMLLVPVFEAEGITKTFEKDNPLYLYFLNEKPKFEFFDVKVVDDDIIHLEKAQNAYDIGSFEAYKELLTEYNVSELLILNIKKEGDLYKVQTKVLPKNKMLEAEVDFSLTDDRLELDKVVKDLVQDTFKRMHKKWVYLSTKTVSPVQVYHLVTPISKVSELKRMKDKFNQLSFAEKVEIKGFKNKMLSVDISFRGNVDDFAHKLELNSMLLSPYTEGEENIYLLTEIKEESELKQKTQQDNIEILIDNGLEQTDGMNIL